LSNTRVTQERVLPGIIQDVNARETQERIILPVTQDVNARTTQERVVIPVKQSVNARVTQERLILAVMPGGRLNIAGRINASGFAFRGSGGRASIAI